MDQPSGQKYTKLPLWKKIHSQRERRQDGRSPTCKEAKYQEINPTGKPRSSLAKSMQRIGTRLPSVLLTLFNDKIRRRRAAMRESQQKRRSFTSFLMLPVELHLQIMRELSFPDVLSLRLVSRTIYAAVTANEKQICRHYLNTNSIPCRLLELYPPEEQQRLSLYYLAGLAHRQIVCTKLAKLLVSAIRGKISPKTPGERLGYMAREDEAMCKNIAPCLVTLFHHLEHHRAAYLKRLGSFDEEASERRHRYAQDSFTVERYYDRQLQFEVRMAYYYLWLHFNLQLSQRRRRHRYGGRDHPGLPSAAQLILLGGPREVERVWAAKGRARRIRALKGWLKQRPRTPLLEIDGYWHMADEDDPSPSSDDDTLDPASPALNRWGARPMGPLTEAQAALVTLAPVGFWDTAFMVREMVEWGVTAVPKLRDMMEVVFRRHTTDGEICRVYFENGLIWTIERMSADWLRR